jgi:hypothetical protein
VIRLAGTKKIPQRQCVGCREMKNKKDLIRVLKTESDGIIIDVTGKKNGRGAYICPNAECLRRAIASKGLERSFKMPIDRSVYDSLEKELENIEAG